MEKMRQELGVMTIKDAIKLGRLRWFGHVNRKHSPWRFQADPGSLGYNGYTHNKQNQ